MLESLSRVLCGYYIYGRVVLITANLKKSDGNKMTIYHQLGNDKNASAKAVKNASMKEGIIHTVVM